MQCAGTHSDSNVENSRMRIGDAVQSPGGAMVASMARATVTSL